MNAERTLSEAKLSARATETRTKPGGSSSIPGSVAWSKPGVVAVDASPRSELIGVRNANADAPELEVLGDTFELPLALSAAPLGVVCETDWKGLNAVIAGFSHGKKVDIGVRLSIAGPSLDSDPSRAG